MKRAHCHARIALAEGAKKKIGKGDGVRDGAPVVRLLTVVERRRKAGHQTIRKEVAVDDAMRCIAYRPWVRCYTRGPTLEHGENRRRV